MMQYDDGQHGFTPVRHTAITRISAEILSVEPIGIHFSEKPKYGDFLYGKSIGNCRLDSDGYLIQASVGCDNGLRQIVCRPYIQYR